MKCPRCSEESPAELNFCRKCGARLITRDPDSTCVITKKMIKDEGVLFPSTGSQVVSLERPEELHQYEPPIVWPARDVEEVSMPAWPVQDYVLPEDSLAFRAKPPFFDKYHDKAFELRGLLRLRNTWTMPSTGSIFQDNYTFSEDIKINNIELLFVKNKSFKGDKKFIGDSKTHIMFEGIESVIVKRKFMRGTFTIRMKPEKGVHRLEVDPVIREITLDILWKDISTARKLQSAIMYDLSTSKLQGLLR